MAATLVTITGTYPPGTEGNVTLRCSAEIENGGTIYPAVPYSGFLTAGALPTDPVTLSIPNVPANNDPGTTPAGTTYTVTELVVGASAVTYAVTVPYNAGASVALTSL